MVSERPQLCTRTAWCVLDLGHEGKCAEIPREPQPKPNYGPTRKGTKR
jgi:hypothetical protein